MAAVTSRPASLPAVALLVYPATLLLGSLFSILSPTARPSRDSYTQPTPPLAPSLASDLHLSENPVNYFARKNNVFNIYFVKIGWLWTTAAFLSLLFFSPLYSSSRPQSASQQETRFRRTLQAVLRYVLITTAWYLSTQWFFGPAIIDRGFVATGGKCERAFEEIGKMGLGGGNPTDLEVLFTAATCKAAGGAWRGGHDISGHVLMLVLATGLLAFEAVGASAPAFLSRFGLNADAGRDRKTSDADSNLPVEPVETSSFARTWTLRLVWGVVGLGWWMLFMTAIWFHTWLEKVCGLSKHPKISNSYADFTRSVVWTAYCSQLCLHCLHPPETLGFSERCNRNSWGIDVILPHHVLIVEITMIDRCVLGTKDKHGGRCQAATVCELTTLLSFLETASSMVDTTCFSLRIPELFPFLRYRYGFLAQVGSFECLS